MRRTFFSIGDEHGGSCQKVMGSVQRESSLRRTMVRTKWFQGLCIEFPVDGPFGSLPAAGTLVNGQMHWTKLKPLSKEALNIARP
jgi:hypothetical protein